MSSSRTLLVGNSFPLALIRRPVRIVPRAHEEWRQVIQQNPGLISFWGHANTLEAASRWAGVDLTPRTLRPALRLDGNGFPALDDQSFTRCWVLSPDYAPGFRPKEGEIVPAEAIVSWQALEMIWE